MEAPAPLECIQLEIAPADPAAEEIGSPDVYWIYRDADGRPLGATARHNRQDGNKMVLPWICLEGKWQCKGFGDKRPLYGLELLAKRPFDAVLLVEGEKAAVAARRLFPDMIGITWQGGTGSIGKTDWSPLNGRDVVMWPDADEPGRKAALELADIVAGLHIVDTAELPNKWDLADPLTEGRTLERVRDVAAKQPTAFNQSASIAERSLPERGAFPVDSLPPVCRAYADELARVYQVPVELPALCIAGVITGALGGSWVVSGAVNGHTTGGNMYFALGLPPEDGKGIVNRIAKPIAEWERLRREKWERGDLPKLEVEYDAFKAEYERYAKKLKEGNGDKDAAATSKAKIRDLEQKLNFDPSLMEQNSTTSGLARKLAQVESEVLFVFSPDAGDVFRTMLGAYTKGADAGDFDLWLKAFSRERHQ